jgi:quercetin dioxygenase-like cupin family protein
MNVLPKPTTVKGPAQMFTGDVYFDAYYKGEEPSRARLNLVRFTPGARTAWHRHAVGKTLHVTEGVGYAQARGGELIQIRAGDTIYTPPGEWHWHGATADTFMCHLAMWEGVAPDSHEPETDWGEHVIDEYPG